MLIHNNINSDKDYIIICYITSHIWKIIYTNYYHNLHLHSKYPQAILILNWYKFKICTDKIIPMSYGCNKNYVKKTNIKTLNSTDYTL